MYEYGIQFDYLKHKFDPVFHVWCDFFSNTKPSLLKMRSFDIFAVRKFFEITESLPESKRGRRVYFRDPATPQITLLLTLSIQRIYIFSIEKAIYF